jgi:hypothetical protein
VQRALAARDEQITLLQEVVGELGMEVGIKRSKVKELKAQQDRNLKNDPHYSDAMRVLEHWKKLCHPGAKELGGKRLENCLARLRGKYTDEQLMRSVTGYALKPYVTNGRRSPSGAKDDWRADAELIFRSPQHVDQGIRIADQADVLRSALSDSRQVTRPTAETTLSDLGEAALRVVKAGWMVFPCLPREKRPATRNGLLNATLSPDPIRKAWTMRPDLNVAIRTGQASNLVVLDVDGQVGYDSLAELGRHYSDLPDTLSVATPRGGSHFYFQHPGTEIQNTTGFPLPGLDIRGDGGYVLSPPSVHPNGKRYVVDQETWPAPMPKWILELLLNRQQKQSDLKGRDWAAFVSDGLNQGERDNRMTSYVGHLFSHGHSAGEVFELAKLLNKNVRPPLTDRDLERIVKSISKAEIRRATR